MPLLLGACATTGTGTVAAEVPQYDSIAFRVSSWGRLIDQWKLTGDGKAEFVKMLPKEGGSFRDYMLERREFALPASDYAQMVRLAAALPQPRPQEDDCKNRITDAAYGSVWLERAGETEEIKFYAGCFDEAYKAFIGQLMAMDKQVSDWAAPHPVTSIETSGD